MLQTNPVEECEESEENEVLASKGEALEEVNESAFESLLASALWPEQGLVLECPTTHHRPCCNSEDGCCARRILEAEKEFHNQKGCLQEDVDWVTVFFSIPSFIMSIILLNAIGVKQNSLEENTVGITLKTMVPEALASITNASIHGFYRLLFCRYTICN